MGGSVINARTHTAANISCTTCKCTYFYTHFSTTTRATLYHFSLHTFYSNGAKLLGRLFIGAAMCLVVRYLARALLMSPQNMRYLSTYLSC